jgi:hypothetical protein
LYSAEGCGETYATSTPLPAFAVEPSITNQTESKFVFQFPITLALIEMIIVIVKFLFQISTNISMGMTF